MSVTFRPATLQDAEIISRIHVQSWQESYKGIIAQEYLDTLSVAERYKLRSHLLTTSTPEHLYLVALIQNKIIGFCDAGPSRLHSDLFQGEIYAIYIENLYKNLGIGSNFMKIVRTHFLIKELLPYIVWVLKENISACHFYEKQGGKIIQEKEEKIGLKFYNTVCYLFT